MIREREIVLAGHGSSVPSTKNMESYLESRYNQKADNGKRKGLVCVLRIKGGLTPAEQVAFHDAYSSILGRNIYSQSLREYVFTPYKGSYYSDCSSSGDACYSKAGHEVGWLNTAGIYQSAKFETVPVEIEAGHVKNPEILQVGDALLFRGNDPSRPLQIGHVEYVFSTPAQDPGWHWVQDGAGWYYQDVSGNNKHGWELIEQTDGGGTHWYYFNSRGRAVTGVQIIDGARYYFQPDGPLECALCVTDEKGALVPWYV